MSGKPNRRNKKRSTSVAKKTNAPGGRNRSIRGASQGDRALVEYTEGPLPDANTMARYEAICPGAMDRILSMVEQQSAHRISLEAAAIPAAIDSEKAGQRYALIVSLASLTVSAILGIVGAHVAAGVVGGSTVVGLAAVFVVGRAAQARERSESRDR